MSSGVSVSYPDFDGQLVESSIGDYLKLLKPGVMMLVVFTGWVGMFMAGSETPAFLQFATILAIALGSGAGGAINMWYDADIDAVMKRTQSRPVPAGKIAAADALMFGLILAALSVMILGLATNWLAAGLLGFSIWFYSFIYTVILKRHTPQNIVIGGAAGAFPPIIGWLATGEALTLEPIIYFAIVFFWTPPHFWALALYRSDDYKKVNVPMLPVTHGVKSTKQHIIIYTFIMVGVSLIPFFIGTSNWLYLASAILLGANFIRHAFVVNATDDTKKSIKMFKFSILYLFILFLCLTVDRVIFVI